MQAGYAANDFWLHGVWPSADAGPSPAWCNATRPFGPAALAGLDQSLPHYMTFSLDRTSANASLPFWRHQWERHGSCSGLGLQPYFLSAYALAASAGLMAALKEANISVSSSRSVPVAAVAAAVERAAGGPLPAKALLCAPGQGGRPSLAKVSVCVSKETFRMVGCAGDSAAAPSPLADDRRADGDSEDAAPALAALQAYDCALAKDGIYLPALANGDYLSGEAWLSAAGEGEYAAAALAALALIFCAAGVAAVIGTRARGRPVGAGVGKGAGGLCGGAVRRARAKPPPGAGDPVDVVSHTLDLDAIEKVDPWLAAVLAALPIGAGVTGDVARRAARAALGAGGPPAAPPVSGRLLLLLPAGADEAARAAATDAAAGLDLGPHAAVAGATAATPAELSTFFATRALVVDAMAILRVAPDHLVLAATQSALADARARAARPAPNAWEPSPDGEPVADRLAVAAAFSDVLAGASTTAALDAATTARWRGDRGGGRLPKPALFRALLPFHADTAAYAAAIDALLATGFLSRRDLADVGGPNRLWGVLVDSVNAAAAARGARFQLDGLDPETIESLVAAGARRPRARAAVDVRLPRALDGAPPFDAAAAVAAAQAAAVARCAAAASGVAAATDARKPPGAAAPKPPRAAAPKPPLPPPPLAAVAPSAAVDHARAAAVDAAASRRAAAAVASARGARGGGGRAPPLPLAPGAGAVRASFYAPPLPEEGVLDAGDAAVRERVPVARLLRFLASAANARRGRLVLACAPLFVATLARLLLPLAFAAGFQALQSGDGEYLAVCGAHAAALAAAAVGAAAAGGAALEFFARAAMLRVTTRLFDHLMFQDAAFLERLSPGELMVRASGGSLTLKSLLTTVPFKFVEGVVLFVGALAFLVTSTFARTSGGGGGGGGAAVLAAVAVAATLLVAECAVAGRWLWRQNLAVRRALGALLGSGADFCGAPAAVAALRLGATVEADARRYVSDYAAAARTQALARAAHAAIISAVTITLRLAILWRAARGSFLGGTTVAHVYALLSYSAWLEQGLQQASTAYGGAMADVGSLERLVELHDRGRVDPRGGREAPLPAGPPCASFLDGGPPGALTGGIAVNKVKVSYPSGGVALAGASLRVGAGAVALVRGGPQSGKSTLLDALALRVMPFKGAIEFEAEAGGGERAWRVFDWVDGDARSARRAQALVAATAASIFPGSLDDNVALGAPEPPTAGALDAAVEAAGVGEVAAALGGRAARVGDGGAPLPPGAELRVALARALLRAPATLLVDDADALVAELGARRLGTVLAREAARGAAVVIAAQRATAADLGMLGAAEYELRDGALFRVD